MFSKSKKANRYGLAFLSDPGGIQTPNLLIRSQMLYSVELRSRLFCVCKDRYNFFSCKGWSKKNPRKGDFLHIFAFNATLLLFNASLFTGKIT